jgi:hypothetical protein
MSKPIAIMGYSTRPVQSHAVLVARGHTEVTDPDDEKRGHVEQPLCKRVVCQSCHARKPKRGGWSESCPGDKRQFNGGDP